MDRYDFNIKVEKLRELAREKDYENAMKIADAIDWRRVQDSKLLQVVSEVYENNGEYGEAKEILLLAYEKSGLGRRFLYKLVELAIKDGNLKEAEAYYKEFGEIAHGDSRKYLLRYQIFTAKGEDIKQRIAALEAFNARELDEKYMYELAKLYYEAGMDEECAKSCDNIMLMFGFGRYVDASIKLKTEKLGIPLSPYQQGLVNNKEQCEDRLRVVEEEFSNQNMDVETIEKEIESRENIIDGIEYEAPNEEEVRQMQELDEEIAKHIESLENRSSNLVEEDIMSDGEKTQEELEESFEDDILPKFISVEEDNEVSGNQESEKEDKVADTINEFTLESVESNKDFSDIEEDIKDIEESIQYTDVDSIEKVVEDKLIYTIENDMNLTLKKAVEELKKQSDYEESRQIIKIKANKLNDKDLKDVFEKLVGKSLVIEEAGDLLEDKYIQIKQESIDKDIKFVLVDNALQIAKLRGEAQVEVREDEVPLGEADLKQETTPEQEVEFKYLNEELGIDDFASYASDYATEIDCTITGKSMLALYERIEFMQDEHIPLTRKNAEDLITEAADKAEKPALLKSIRSVLSFERRYDKDGKLILKEEHFIV